MKGSRWLLYTFLFFLITINYADRIALSIAAKPIADEFGLSPIALGYLFSLVGGSDPPATAIFSMG